MQIQKATTATDILKCWEVIKVLRPHLEQDLFVATVNEMMTEGYRLVFIEEDGKAAAAVGFRYLQYLYNGKHFYIDDLSTLPESREIGRAHV